MTKKSLVLFLCLLAAYYAKAALTVSKASDGTVTLTLNAGGDLKNGFASLTADIKQAQNVIVVTKEGVSMTGDDVKTLCGDYSIDNFPNIVKLNLENARLANDADLVRLGFMDKLKSLTFSKYTTNVPNSCIINKDNHCIEEIIIPDNPDREVMLGTQAFSASTLKKVVLGTSIKEVGHECFYNCTSLTTVIFHHGKNMKIGTHAFYGCTALTDVVLPEGLEEIGVGAFESSAITSIRLPNTLKYIRTEAFGLCHNLKSITIPANVELIETEAFQQGYNLKDVYVLGENTKCANHAFQPVNTYNYVYDGTGNGEEVERNAFRTLDPLMNVRTVLHYPKNAYDNYINEDIKKLGTPGYDRKWVQLKDGNRCATTNDGKYDNTGYYAGWNNFMLTAEIRDEEIWEDDKRVNDKWYTICLPFDVTRDQLRSAYGALVEVVEFSDVEVTKNDKGKVKTIKLKFKKQVDSMVAHHPYMIHPAVSKITGGGVVNVITGIAKQPEIQSSLNAQKVSITAADNVTYTFIGNYDKAKKLQQYSYYYYSGNDTTQYKNGFYKWDNAEGGTWTPYTACVLLDKNNGANSKAETEYPENEDEIVIDGIYNMTADEYRNSDNNNVIYNVYGHAVGNGTDNMDKLPKGIYIVNGKKYIVK